MRAWLGIVVSSVALLSAACSLDAQPGARVVREVPWRDGGVWLRADLHSHTQFSDGAHTVTDVVSAAHRNGCDVVAITDHAEERLRGASPEYLTAIRQARVQEPGIVIVAGLEWNVPPGRGDEHATVLFSTGAESTGSLAEFKTRFDDRRADGSSPGTAEDALAFLASQAGDGPAPVVSINHPSRRNASASAPRLRLPQLARAVPGMVIGFEGAPGHQRGEPVGAYISDPKPIERWDPIAAEVGGAWDSWLGEGLDLWGALASADFHHESGDFWPCEFATTWIYAPERTVDGVLRALRAGSFFAEHGRIVNQATLVVALDGESHPLESGDVGEAVPGTTLTATLTIEATEHDYLGRANRIDAVELIAVTAEGSRVVRAGSPAGAGPAMRERLTLPVGGIVLRARGRRVLDDGTGLMFYTNPIRVLAR